MKKIVEMVALDPEQMPHGYARLIQVQGSLSVEVVQESEEIQMIFKPKHNFQFKVKGVDTQLDWLAEQVIKPVRIGDHKESSGLKRDENGSAGNRLTIKFNSQHRHAFIHLLGILKICFDTKDLVVINYLMTHTGLFSKRKMPEKFEQEMAGPDSRAKRHPGPV